ncbi:hypothetical protein LCGC14_0980980 [marine sediment metagenome]|uniref:Uncharacterized protein n=1 Tax=marine sediment metagenome TaxID=412755 RepID=A0A0F9N8Q4_9ZZZZ
MLNEDFDEKNQPSNPAWNQTVHQFLEDQRIRAEREYPEGTVFKCIRCGDCCRSNYYHLKVEDQRLLDRLHMLLKDPHGHWILTVDGKFSGHMPSFKRVRSSPESPEVEEYEMEVVSFEGPIPEEHVRFQIRTGRRHGYWVLTKDTDEIVVYYPVACLHLVREEGKLAECLIYEDRPEFCRGYICRRYPVEKPS